MQRLFRTVLSLAVTCGLLILVAAPAVHAVPMLSLSTVDKNGNPVVATITDGGSGDLASDPGVIFFYGPLGNFGVNITSGITKPTIGSADEPILDISSANITSIGAGTLIITFSENGFTGSVPNGFTGSGVVNTNGAGVTYSAFLDTTNTIHNATDQFLGVSLGTTGVLTGSGSSSVFFSGVAPTSSPYALTQQIVITHSAAGQITSVDAMLHAPEPASLVLLGSGLLGLGLLGRRKKVLGLKVSRL